MKSPILSVAMGPHFFVPLGSGTAEVFTQFADEAHRSRIPSRDAGRGGSKGICEMGSVLQRKKRAMRRGPQEVIRSD